MTKSKKPTALNLVKACCRLLDEKKAASITVLDVSANSSITDYLVLATATSEPHLRALRVELEKVLDASGSRIVGIEMAQESGWVVVDVFDVMIHLFLGATRDHYSLERLWRDATEISLSRLLAKTETPKTKSSSEKRGSKTPARRTKTPRKK
jgi:ribosome-associated protein